MKLFISIILFLSLAAHLGAAEVPAQNSAVLVLSPDKQTAEARAAVDKLKSDMEAKGISVTEIPADEAQDISQAGLIGGGPVITTKSQAGKIEYEVHDGVSGADITKTFKAGLEPEVKAAPKPEPAHVVKMKPAPVEPPKPVEKADAREKSAFPRNHIGLSLGMSSLTKNEDSLEMLQQFNAGSQITYTKESGRFQLFYERGLSEKYTLGFAAELSKGSGNTYDKNGRTLNITPSPKVANIYVMRNFGRHFGLYLGGGADLISFTIDDQSDMAGIGFGHEPFKGEVTAAHAEAGMAFSAGDFSLRFSLRKILAAETSDITTTVNGSKCRLTVKNGSTLSYKIEGQSLAANEQYYKADFGGTAAAVSLTYSFANW